MTCHADYILKVTTMVTFVGANSPGFVNHNISDHTQFCMIGATKQMGREVLFEGHCLKNMCNYTNLVYNSNYLILTRYDCYDKI